MVSRVVLWGMLVISSAVLFAETGQENCTLTLAYLDHQVSGRFVCTVYGEDLRAESVETDSMFMMNNLTDIFITYADGQVELYEGSVEKYVDEWYFMLHGMVVAKVELD